MIAGFGAPVAREDAPERAVQRAAGRGEASTGPPRPAGWRVKPEIEKGDRALSPSRSEQRSRTGLTPQAVPTPLTERPQVPRPEYGLWLSLPVRVQLPIPSHSIVERRSIQVAAGPFFPTFRARGSCGRYR
jgi:hypothetical protein